MDLRPGTQQIGYATEILGNGRGQQAKYTGHSPRLRPRPRLWAHALAPDLALYGRLCVGSYALNETIRLIN